MPNVSWDLEDVVNVVVKIFVIMLKVQILLGTTKSVIVLIRGILIIFNNPPLYLVNS